MTDYKTIKGKRVKFFETDLDNEQAEGQLFFSDTDKEMKTAVASSAWSSSGPLGSGRYGLGGAGSQTAALGFAGYSAPSPGYSESQKTEEYNGVGWTTGGTLGGSRYLIGGAGTQTAGLAFGGNAPGTGRSALTEEYDGSSWTESGDLSTARRGLGSAGTQTAAAAFGGDTNGGGVTPVVATEEYNGTSWTNGGDLNTSRSLANQGYVGTQDATFFAGGATPSLSNAVEEYNGTSWTTVTSLPAARRNSGVAGIQTNAILFGGALPSVTNTALSYDGTNWTSAPNLGSSISTNAGAGTASAGLSFGGTSGPTTGTTNTEEFNVTVNTITAAAWASGGNYPTNNYGLQGAGSQTAGLAWCGDANGATTNVTAEYNGSSWTTSGNYPFSGWRIGGDGTQTAAIGSGGVNNSADFQPTTNTYDGSSWTDSGNNLPANRRSHAMVGTQTSALVFGGSPTTTTLEYNGSSYSSAPALATPRAGMHALGTQTAALCGATPPNLASEEYNGSSWSTGGSQIKATGSSAEGNGTGTQTAGMFVGGYPSQATTQLYDGTIFITAPNLGSAGYGLGQSSSSSTAALAFGGYRGGYSNSTEEFTGETTSLNLKTITDS